MKDATSAGTLEAAYNQFKPMVDELPFLKPYLESKKLEYYLRTEGTKANILVLAIGVFDFAHSKLIK